MRRFTSLVALAAFAVATPALADHHGEAMMGENHAHHPALKQAVASDVRSGDAARDEWRNPFETLDFFGVTPGMTVVDYMPAGGWYTRILVPYLGADGQYVGLTPDPAAADSERFGEYFGGLPAKFEEVSPGWNLSGAPMSIYASQDVPEAMAGTVDRALIFREMHNLLRSGVLYNELTRIRSMLKDDGMLGIVQHRAKDDAPGDYTNGSKGYLRQEDVIALVEALGFELVGMSDINANPADPANWEGGVWTLPPSNMPDHLRLSRGQAVHGLEGFEVGAWWVQDLAASLPARLLGEGNGRRVLDLCAAPGGKTLQLAAQGWQVTALDISAKRLKLLEENLARTGLEAEVIAADAFKWEPEAPFDAILIDAPCTATGTARRHPDVLHRIGPRQIADLAEVQARLLDRASGWLTPGGMLAYAVCSLESEEGEAQAEKVWLTTEPISAEELPAGLSPTAKGTLRTDPGMLPEHGGLDGFFVARWRKS